MKRVVVYNSFKLLILEFVIVYSISRLISYFPYKRSYYETYMDLD